MQHVYKFLYLAVIGGVSILTLLLPKVGVLDTSPADPLGTPFSNPSIVDNAQPEEQEAENPLPPSAQTGESLVVLPDQASVSSFLAQNNLPAESLTASGLANTYVVNKPIEGLDAAGYEAFPNLKYQAVATPDDPDYSSQWHLPKISGPAAWDVTTGSSSVTIAVIDTGFALSHEDLATKLTASGTWRDFVCNDNVPQAGDADCDSNPTHANASHGTLTSGTAGAIANNTTGVASVDWGAKILPLQALADNGSGSTADVASAVEYAKDQGVDVISMSLGSTGTDSLLRAEIDEAIAAGVTVVAAIGNCGGTDYALQGCDFQGQQLDPGRYGPVIGVGASASNDTRASFSSYGSGVDLIAPGVSILSTDWSNSNQTTLYGSASGTSLATPVVSGVVGLLKAEHSTLSESEVTTVLTNSVVKVSQMGGANYTEQHGYGRIDAQKVVNLSGLVCPANIPTKGNIPAAGSGQKILGNHLGGSVELLSRTQLNNTGTGCIEVHTYTSNLQGYLQHIPTNRSGIDPADAGLIAADTNGDGVDELMTVEYQNTGSGKIEVHRWTGSYQQWAAHIASNRPAINPADAEVISADTDGNGVDELYLVQYRNTSSGQVEVHGWTANLQQWFLHAATNQPAINPDNDRIIAADTDGSGTDEFVLVKYQNTSSGRIEVHGWTSDFQQWFLHRATNHYELSPASNEVIAANIDGSGADEPLLIRYSGTASGKIEVHGWTYDFQGWFLHAALP